MRLACLIGVALLAGIAGCAGSKPAAGLRRPIVVCRWSSHMWRSSAPVDSTGSPVNMDEWDGAVLTCAATTFSKTMADCENVVKLGAY